MARWTDIVTPFWIAGPCYRIAREVYADRSPRARENPIPAVEGYWPRQDSVASASDTVYRIGVNSPIRESTMSRLTITLSEARYRALKEASAQRNKTIGQLIEESLEFYGIKTREDARALVQRARRHSGLSEDQALALAEKEVKATRRR
jgi:hypothetical protein